MLVLLGVYYDVPWEFVRMHANTDFAILPPEYFWLADTCESPCLVLSFSRIMMQFLIRKWQPTPVFLPGESHGWRSLVGYTVHGVAKSRTRLSERLHSLSHCDLWRCLKNPCSHVVLGIMVCLWISEVGCVSTCYVCVKLFFSIFSDNIFNLFYFE